VKEPAFVKLLVLFCGTLLFLSALNVGIWQIPFLLLSRGYGFLYILLILLIAMIDCLNSTPTLYF
jgi:hypothetical protein